MKLLYFEHTKGRQCEINIVVAPEIKKEEENYYHNFLQ